MSGPTTTSLQSSQSHVNTEESNTVRTSSTVEVNGQKRTLSISKAVTTIAEKLKSFPKTLTSACERWAMSIKDVPDNILDISLACYANYSVSQLKKGRDLYESEFYLFWRKYDSFEKYPLTKRVLGEYQKKIIEYGLK